MPTVSLCRLDSAHQLVGCSVLSRSQLLGRLLQCLAIVVDASGAHNALAPRMFDALLEFVLAVRRHREPFVRRCVVCGSRLLRSFHRCAAKTQTALVCLRRRPLCRQRRQRSWYFGERERESARDGYCDLTRVACQLTPNMLRLVDQCRAWINGASACGSSASSL